MVHIDWGGNLIDIGGSIEDLGTDISKLMVSVIFGMQESGECSEEDMSEFVGTVLMNAIDAAHIEGAEDIIRAIRSGSEKLKDYVPGLYLPSEWNSRSKTS